MKLDAESKKTSCKGAVKLLEVSVTKLQERSPLKSTKDVVFTPVNMVSEKKVSNVKLGNFVDRLCRSKRLSSSQSNNAKC